MARREEAAASGVDEVERRAVERGSAGPIPAGRAHGTASRVRESQASIRGGSR